MDTKIMLGILIPFLGTSLGAGMVFFFERFYLDKRAKNFDRICVGSNDSGIILEFIATCT